MKYGHENSELFSTTIILEPETEVSEHHRNKKYYTVAFCNTFNKGVRAKSQCIGMYHQN